jgi:hypothetical protein
MSLGVGEVEIKLMNLKSGELESVVLKPSLRAAKLISRQSEGYMGASQAVLNLNFDATVQILKIALALTDHGAEDLQDRVYRTGLPPLAAPLIQFIRILANGGKPPVDPELEAAKDGEDPLD